MQAIVPVEVSVMSYVRTLDKCPQKTSQSYHPIPVKAHLGIMTISTGLLNQKCPVNELRIDTPVIPHHVLKV